MNKRGIGGMGITLIIIAVIALGAITIPAVRGVIQSVFTEPTPCSENPYDPDCTCELGEIRVTAAELLNLSAEPGHNIYKFKVCTGVSDFIDDGNPAQDINIARYGETLLDSFCENCNLRNCPQDHDLRIGIIPDLNGESAVLLECVFEEPNDSGGATIRAKYEILFSLQSGEILGFVPNEPRLGCFNRDPLTGEAIDGNQCVLP